MQKSYYPPDIKVEKKKKGGKGGKKNSKNKSNLTDQVKRIYCDCEATKHALVNNCLYCGRIICASEGPGPCLFCGRDVSYENDLKPTLKYAKESDNKQKQSHEKIGPVYDPSTTIKLRDKLLEYDKNAASKTSVIDDECDYYQANNTWLTKEERERWEKMAMQSHEEKHMSRLHRKITVDFTGRVLQQERQDPFEIMSQMNSVRNEWDYDYRSMNSSSRIKNFKEPIYIENGNLPSNAPDIEEINRINSRVQDKGILEMSDQGVCLSMHQPYASLLVRGIKKTEGRTWYTSHRGRLWIASAVKEIRPEEIKAIEEMHKLRNLGDEKIEFPKTYPTGCLLGCVTLTDVLSQEEYTKLYPDSPVDSPYIFICEDYFELSTKYPVQGKHKIYKLEPIIHRAALTCLEKTIEKMSKKNY